MPADASSPENRCASASNRRVFADSNGASISVHARTAFRSSTIAGVGSSSYVSVAPFVWCAIACNIGESYLDAISPSSPAVARASAMS